MLIEVVGATWLDVYYSYHSNPLPIKQEIAILMDLCFSKLISSTIVFTTKSIRPILSYGLPSNLWREVLI